MGQGLFGIERLGSLICGVRHLLLCCAGKFNPYGELDLGRIKGGKRSGVAPRSGNRSFSFK